MDVSYGELVIKNIWDESAGDGRSQTLRIKSESPLAWEWEWNYPTPGGYVKSYPSVVYGGPPYRDTSSTPNLPVLLSELPDFVVDLNTTTTGVGSYNASFDVWFTAVPNPVRGVSSHEMMIWLDGKNLWTGGAVPDKRVMIGAREYDLYSTRVFISVEPFSSGRINISDFIRVLLDGGYIAPTEYLGSIEYGNEIVYGSGKTVVNSYSVSKT